MSNTQIPNLPAAISLNGTEQLEAVQSGTSVKVTASQIAAYTAAAYPAPGVSTINTDAPITGGPITTTGTIGLASAGVSNTYLAFMPGGTVKANLTGIANSPTDATPSQVLDLIGTAQGGMLYRGASAWSVLPIGPSGQILASAGSPNPPYWTTPTASFLGLGTMANQNANAVAITGGTINGTTIGGSTPAAASFTSLTATGTTSLSTVSSGNWQGTPIAVLYGGTGATTAAAARTNLGAAKSGANSDITSLTGLTTPLAETEGGTGYGSYTTGDILYASSATTLARLNDVATGNVLLSGGVGVAPSYGKVDLTAAVSNTLPVSSGGTGQSSALTQYGLVYGASTSAMGTTAAGTTGQVLTASTGNPPFWGPNSITFGSTSVALGGSTSILENLTYVSVTQDPTTALQLSTKQYVDAQVATVSNQTFHTAVSYATTADLGSVAYNNGSGGVGATLTNAGTQAALAIDGHTFTGTDVANATRVLVKDEATPAYNGVYVVTNEGSGSANWVLTRAADFDTVGSGPNKIETGAAFFVSGGTTYGSTSWVLTTTGTINVGATALVFAQTSSSGNIFVTSPLSKVGNVISLGTVGVANGGTGLTTLTANNLLYSATASSIGQIPPSVTASYPLLSNGSSAAPTFAQLPLTTGVTGTLPVTNGGTGTSTAFTSGSVVFADGSGIYTQNNSKLFWDNVNYRLGVNTGAPNSTVAIVSNTQTAAPPSSGLPTGTDLYIMGANGADTRVTQDAYGAGNYGAYTARQARGTAASPTATQSGDFLAQFTGRGYGATGFGAASTGCFSLGAAENFTDTAQGTYASVHTTAIGANSPTEAFRFGPAGQLGIGGATYGTNGYALVSGGASAAPSWSQISLTTGVTGALPATNGGTGQSSYTTGDILYASSSSALSRLADVATGNVLLSGGVGVAPSWGKVDLTTAVNGTLPIGNGGTNSTATPTAGSVAYGTGTALGWTAAGTSGQVLTSNGAGAPSWATPPATGVTTFSGNTTGLFPNTPTSGAIALSGTLVVANGGTGVSALTGYAKGSGTSAFTGVSTIPTTDGGTGLTSFTSGGAVYATSTSALTTGTLPIASGGTGQTTASAAFNALSPITTTGDLIIGNGTNSATRLGIGANGYVLTSNGTTATWAPPSGGVASFSGGTTGLTPSTATTGAITLAGTLSVANGGTGLTSGTSGGVPYYSGSSTIASSAVLAANGIVLGGGAGAAPSTTSTLTYSSTNTGSSASPNLSITPTWNTTGVVDAAVLVNVTNTASGAGSLLADLQVGGTSQWKVDKSGNQTLLGTVNMGSSFLRNRIINGAMAVDQRNAGASQTITAAAALAYTVDRWYAYCTGANVTGQRVTGAVANTYNYRFTGAASVTAIGFGQRIEALNSADLAGTTATLSVDLANSVLTTVTWTAYYANTTDTFGTLASPTRTQIATGTFSVNSTVTRYSTQISIPAAATTGIEILFTVGAQTSGTWTIGNAQLEAGTQATAFERRQYGSELVLAQRYYCKSYSLNVVPGTAVGSGAGGVIALFPVNTGLVSVFYTFPVEMRVLPTVSYYDNAGTPGKISLFKTSTWTNGEALGGGSVLATRSAYQASAVAAYNMSFDYTSSAEL